jgi:IS605 OrfB family transposase
MSTFAYETLVPVSATADAALRAYAKQFGEAERQLFVKLTSGGDPTELKPELCRELGVTARQYNAIRVQLEGKIAGFKAHRKFLIQDLAIRINKAQKMVDKLENPPKPRRKRGSPAVIEETPPDKEKRLFKLHQKRRRLAALKGKLAALKADDKEGIVRIAFGSRKLFRAQFDLEANGYESHEEWREDWRAERSRQFLVIGSKDETAGCQGCVATLNEDESLNLRVRLPDAVLQDPSIEAVDGKYVILRGLKFAHGHENVLKALQCCQPCEGEHAMRRGAALTWRFLRDVKHGEPVWYIHVMVDVTAPAIVTRREAGAVGVDYNPSQLAVAETDRSGNLIDHERIDTALRYKTAGQREAILGDAVKKLVARAQTAGKPIVVEKLDFSAKRGQLEDVSPGYARMLSALAYRKFDRMLKAACFRAGVEVIDVDPAYTSVIGAINYAQIFGISTHAAAAYVIARRGLNLSETLRSSVKRDGACVPAPNGDHVTFPLPVDSGKHVRWPWPAARRKLRAALEAHYRCGKGCNPKPPPLPPKLKELHKVAASATGSSG